MWPMSASHPTVAAQWRDRFKVHPCFEELETRAVPSTTQPLALSNADIVSASEATSNSETVTSALAPTAQTQQTASAQAVLAGVAGNALLLTGQSPAQPLATVGAPLAPFAVGFSPTSPVGANGAPTTPQSAQAEVPASSLTVTVGGEANPALLAESPVLAQMHESTQITGGAAEDFGAGGASPGGRSVEQPRPATATPAANVRPANTKAVQPIGGYEITTPATPKRGNFWPDFGRQRQAPRPAIVPAAPGPVEELGKPDQQSRTNPQLRERSRPMDAAAAVAMMLPGLGLAWEERRAKQRRVKH